MGRRASVVLAMVIAAALVALLAGRSVTDLVRTAKSRRTVHDAVTEFGPAARERLAPAFRSAGVAYPPANAKLAAIKDTRVLEVWALDSGVWRHIRTYSVLGTSGNPGPKLREGDRQVPEGLYRIESLNPDSAYHLSMRLDYPNRFDREHAEGDGRTDLGGDIFVHGSDRSVGCLAMGDEAIEDLFVLVCDVGRQNVSVVIAPSDPRRGPLLIPPRGAPTWLPELYEAIEREFKSMSASTQL